MAGATNLGAIQELLKEVYEPKLRNQLESEIVTLKRIESTSEGISHEVGGKYVTFGLLVRRNHGIGSRNENEPLPVARSQKYAAARILLKNSYGSISLTGPTMELAVTNEQAFASALTQEVDGVKDTVRKDMNRQTYGTTAGTMAAIPTGSAGARFSHVVSNSQYLEDGMIVDVLSSTGAVVRVAEAEIVSITTTTAPAATVVFNKSFDSTDLDIIVRYNSYGRERTGFTDIVSETGTLYNVDPAVHPVWKATVNANGGTPRALSEGLMIKMEDDIRNKGGKVSVIFTSKGVRRAYFNLLVQQRRFTNTAKFEGGFSGLAFTTDDGDIPVVSDKDAPPNKQWFITEKELKHYQAGDWSFMNRNGSMWDTVHTAEGKFDAYEATLYKYSELGTHRRNAHGLLSDITEAN